MIDHMLGNVEEAILGYAHAGNEPRVKHLLKLAYVPNIALLGYARGGHKDLINKILDAANESELPSLLLIVIKGYACAGRQTEVDNLLKKLEDSNPPLMNFTTRHLQFHAALEGYGQCGFLPNIYELHQHIVTPFST